MDRKLFVMVDTFSKRVVAARRMTTGEAMGLNLLYATKYAYWTINPPANCE